ncbi:Hsp70 family protein [Desulfosoma sp.]
MTSPLLCGIDLGTTNSVLSIIRNGQPEAVPVDNGSAVVPSVLSHDETTGRILVGREAKNRLAAFPQCTARSIKRLMGTDKTVELGSLRLSPEEASAHILRYLTRQGSELLGRPIRDVVITVPAYFDDAQRRATVRAGELADLQVTRIINEPTAAALFYSHLDLGRDWNGERLLVYDLGGGTFDVSILEMRGEIREVLASCGDTHLGGDDFDERLMEFFLEEVLDEVEALNAMEELLLRLRLRDVAEKVKIELSRYPYVQVREVGLVVVNGEPINVECEVTRELFESLSQDLLERTEEKVQEALKEASLDPSHIDAVILAGGATRMPCIQKSLSALFGRNIAHLIDPDLCVAHGAAIQSGLVAGEPLGHILMDVTAHTLGIRTADVADPFTGEADFYSPIIRRNTHIPVTRAETYFTLWDNQELAKIDVYQGENASCRLNTLVGTFDFPLQPAPAGSPLVVEFSYDREGMIHVMVEQKGYTNRKEVTVDVRRRTCVEEDAPGTRTDTPLNYICSKARRVLAEASLSPEERKTLKRTLMAYENALRNGQDNSRIDELEDALLDFLEEIERD